MKRELFRTHARMLGLTVFFAIHAAAQDSSGPQAPFPAQQSENPANPDRPTWKLLKDIGSDFRHFPSRDTLLWLGVGGAFSGLAYPIDKKVNAHLVGKAWVEEAFDPGRIIGYGPVQAGAAVLTYGVGRLSDHPRVTHVGVDLIRVQILTGALTYGIKHAVRRERPDGSNKLSFPSGHSSVTFASATVLQRHLGWKAAIPTYAVASYVATSRLHENRHHFSDVIFGAALGIAAGRTVTRHGRSQWVILPGATPGGVAVSVTRMSRP